MTHLTSEMAKRKLHSTLLYVNDRFIYRVADFIGNASNLRNTWRDIEPKGNISATNMISLNARDFNIETEINGDTHTIKIAASLDNFNSSCRDINDIHMFYMEACISAMDFPYMSENVSLFSIDTPTSRDLGEVFSSIWKGKFWLSFSDLSLTETVNSLILEYSCTENIHTEKLAIPENLMQELVNIGGINTNHG